MENVETERFYTKKATNKDALSIFEIWSAAENKKFLWYPPSIENPDLYLIKLKEWCDAKNIIENTIIKIVVDKTNNEIIGTCHFGENGTKNEWEFGYNLKSSKWGQGIATELLASIIALGKQKGVTRFLGCTDEKNIASIKVMQKNGLTFCGKDKDGNPKFELIISKTVDN